MTYEEDEFIEAFFGGRRNDDHHACRWCLHALGSHNNVVGCKSCSCVSSKSEARPRTDFELSRDARPATFTRSGYYPLPTTAPRKDADMRSKTQIERELKALDANEALIISRREALQREMDERLALPAEPDEDAVIKFRVQFDPDGIVYTFIATRTRRNSSAQWYTTGSNTKHKGPHSWDDLLSIMMQDQGVKSGASKLEFFLFDGGGKWVR
jgi:hypothetical protein